MVDIDNIFELFSEGDDLDGENNSTTYIDFKETPIYWVGMFKKIILNHNNFNKKVIQFFKKADEELDLDDVKEAGEFVVYNRAWNYIQNVDINANLHIKSIEKYADEYLSNLSPFPFPFLPCIMKLRQINLVSKLFLKFFYFVKD
jgi:hypothetical protein